MSRRSERTISVLVPPDLTPTTPEDPRTIGPYVLVGRLGTTEAGSVYAAIHPDVEPEVLLAVKVIPSSHVADEAARTRLEQRIRTLGAVDGRCYVPPTAFDVRGTPPWVAMRYSPGTPLEQYIDQRGPLRLGRLTALAAGLGEALAALHSLDVVHGDLKPSSVLLSSAGPRLLDCSLSGEAPAPAGSTPWLSPERLRGAAPTAASDVFSWGAVLAFAATGRPPFGTGTPEEIAERIASGSLDLTDAAEEIRPLLEPALAADPAQRPNIRELVRSSISLWESSLGSVGSEAGSGSGVTRLLTREWQGIVEPALLPRVVHLDDRARGKRSGRMPLTMPVPLLSRSSQQSTPAASPAAPADSPDSTRHSADKTAATAVVEREDAAAGKASTPAGTAPTPPSSGSTASPSADSLVSRSSGQPKPRASDKRLLAVVGGGAVAALLLLGGSVWAVSSLFSGEDEPQETTSQADFVPEEVPQEEPPPSWDTGTLVVRLDSSSEVNLLAGPWPYTPVEPASGGDAFAGLNGQEVTPEEWSESWTPVEGVEEPLEALIASDAEVMCAHFCLNPDQVYVDEEGRGTYTVTGRDLGNYLSWGDVVIAEVTFGDPDPETGLPVITKVTELYPPPAE